MRWQKWTWRPIQDFKFPVLLRAVCQSDNLTGFMNDNFRRMQCWREAASISEFRKWLVRDDGDLGSDSGGDGRE